MPCGQNVQQLPQRTRELRPPITVAPEVQKWTKLLPCLYRGDRTDACKDCEGTAIFDCTKLGKPCVIGRVMGKDSEIVSCNGCEHRTKGLTGQPEVDAVLVQLRSGRSSWQPGYWLARENANARKALKVFIEEAEAEAKGQQCPEGFKGRGIVVLGGGEKYYPSAWVCVSLLRRFGCKLPIEWWYLGSRELDFAMRSIAGSIEGVELVDMEKRFPGRRRSGGWEAKIHAIMGSKFQEVLFLDADQVPVTNPEFLFETPEFKSRGALLWPDHLPKGWDICREAFEVFGLPVPGNEQMPTLGKPTDYDPTESGQVLVDKSRCWQALAMVRWINEHSDIFFPAKGNPEFFYGDKSTFYLGFQKIGHEYAIAPPAGFIGSDLGGAFLQHAPDGRLVFQHRVQPVRKLLLHGDNVHPQGFQRVKELEAALVDLRSQWSGNLYGWENMGPADVAVARRTAGRWLRKRGTEIVEVQLRPTGVYNDRQDSHWSVNHNKQTPFLAIVEGGQAKLFGKEGASWVCDGDSLTPLLRSLGTLSLNGDELFILEEIAGNIYKLPDDLSGVTVVDVGAHVGAFALSCLDRGAERVIAIEPDPVNYGHLLTNCAEHLGGRLLAFNLAAWSSPAVLPFARRAGAMHSAGGSVVVEQGERVVPAMSLEAILEVAGVKDHLWLKVDCEGAEYEIIRSVDLGRFDAISLEWHANALDRKRGANPPELAEFLKRWGFEVETSKPLESDLGLLWARR